MKQFFDFIKDKIETDIDEIKTVEKWDNQINREEIDMMERGIPKPAVFIEFNVIDVDNIGYDIKNFEMQVIFHFSIEDYQHSKTDSWDLLERFDNVMTRFSQREDSTKPLFSSFIEGVEEADNFATNIDHPVLIYDTILTRHHAFKVLTEGILTGVTIDPVIVDP